MSSPALPTTAQKNVKTIAKVEQQLLEQRSKVDRIGDAITRFFGRLRFIVAHVLFFTGWFVVKPYIKGIKTTPNDDQWLGDFFTWSIQIAQH